MKKKFLLLFLILSIGLVFALPNDSGTKIDFTYVEETNYSTVNVNNSDYWDNLDTPNDISSMDNFYNTTEVNNNYLSINGSNANQDINIGSYDFTTTGTITGDEIDTKKLVLTGDSTQTNLMDMNIGYDGESNFIGQNIDLTTTRSSSSNLIDFTAVNNKIYFGKDWMVTGSVTPKSAYYYNSKNRFRIDSTHEANLIYGSVNEYLYNSYNDIARIGKQNVSTLNDYIYGTYNFVQDSSYADTGTTMNHALYGVSNIVQHNMPSGYGTDNVYAYGDYVSVYVGNNANVGNAYGVYIYRVSAPDEAWGIYNNGADANNFLGKDNVKTCFGSSQCSDSSIQFDGVNLIINSSNHTLFYNSSGAGTIGYGSAYTFTEVNNESDVLESFNLGNELYNDDGSINHSAFGDCYAQLPVKNTSDCWEVYEYTHYCYEIINTTENKSTINCYKEEINYPTPPKDIKINLKTTDVYRKECSTYLKDAVDVNCEQAKQRQSLALLNRNVNLNEGVTDFDTDVLAENIFTQSKTINPTTNYLDLFDRNLISNKETHYAYVNDIKKTKKSGLNVEDRIVALEGAIVELKEENNLLKTELCKKDNTYSFCREGAVI